MGFSSVKVKKVKAIKLRGILSTGLLLPAKDEWEIGQDVTEEIGITKYEEPVEKLSRAGNPIKAPNGSIVYTDIQNVRRYPNVFKSNEHIVLREKVHGGNFRAVYQNGQVYCGSKVTWLKEDNSIWWNAAFKSGLPDILPNHENKIFFGEAYGAVQDMKYGHNKGEVSLTLFDIFDISKGKYVDNDEFNDIIGQTGLPTAPVIYEGPWLGFEEMLRFTEGNSIIHPDTPFKEGWVAKPFFERYDPEIGRVILKCISTGYLLKKEK